MNTVIILNFVNVVMLIMLLFNVIFYNKNNDFRGDVRGISA